MTAACRSIVLAVAALLGQSPSAAELVRLPRTLDAAESAVVLDAARRALDGKTFTFTSPGRDDGPEFLMGPGGRPRLVRIRRQMEGGVVGGVIAGGPPHPVVRFHIDTTDVIHYTGLAARRCDGAPASGELVITYERDNETGKWTADAATSPDRHIGPFLTPYADLLQGQLRASSPVSDQFSRDVERGMTAAFTPPPKTFGLGEHPEGATQTLWVDIDSLLPVRWEVSARGDVIDTRLFRYKPIDLRPPDGVQPPACMR